MSAHANSFTGCWTMAALCWLACSAGWTADDVEMAVETAIDLPEKYLLEYPPARQWCPPIRTTFLEVTRRELIVRGKRFRQQLNGGYGLPIVDKVGDRHLIHVGADLGWHQIGEPVFAVADGVVRVSQGPPSSLPATGKKHSPKPANPAKPDSHGRTLPWGNLVVVEHREHDRDANFQYFTTIYGHLDQDRQVQLGETVKAGQLIGFIGRKSAAINGGYDPHVHFAVRSGRIIEPGRGLLKLRHADTTEWIRVISCDEQQVEVTTPAGPPKTWHINLNGTRFEILTADGKTTLKAKFLWRMSPPEFPIVGYSLTTDGFLDPIQFLREHRADTQPAAYGDILSRRRPRN